MPLQLLLPSLSLLSLSILCTAAVVPAPAGAFLSIEHAHVRTNSPGIFIFIIEANQFRCNSLGHLFFYMLCHLNALGLFTRTAVRKREEDRSHCASNIVGAAILHGC